MKRQTLPVAGTPTVGDVLTWDGYQPAWQRPRREYRTLHTDTVTRIVMGKWQSPDFVTGSAGWAFSADGSLEANDITARGTLYGLAGEVGGWTIGATTLASGTNIILDSDNKRFSINSATFGEAGIQLEYNSGTPRAYIGNGSTKYVQWDGTDLTVNGSVLTSIQSGSELAIQGWQFSGTFSATDADTVAWTSGTLTFLNGDAYSISAGNTANMAAKTYIYFDKATSTTALQTTTTAATAVGANKVLIAVAENSTTEALYQVFGGSGGIQIPGSVIEANSITANEIAANTITAGEMNVGTLSAIAADMGTLTAGEIRLYTGTWDSDATGLRLNGTELAGQNAGVDQVVLSAATGKLTAGGGEHHDRRERNHVRE